MSRYKGVGGNDTQQLREQANGRAERIAAVHGASGALLVLVLSVPLLLLSRATFAQTAPPPATEPKATAIILTTIAAAGWSKLADIQDGTATCLLSTAKGEDASAGTPLIIRATPQHRVRVENGSTILSKDGMYLAAANGSVSTKIRPRYAQSIIAEPFPFWTVWQDWNSSGTFLQYIGAAEIDGETVDKVQITTIPWGSGTPSVDRSLDEFVFFISRNTHLPTQVTYRLPAANSLLVSSLITLKWESYANIEGISVPMRISKFVNGTRVTTLAVSDVKWNQGITASTFHLTSIQ